MRGYNQRVWEQIESFFCFFFIIIIIIIIIISNIFLQYNMDITYKLQLNFIQCTTTYNTTTTYKYYPYLQKKKQFLQFQIRYTNR